MSMFLVLPLYLAAIALTILYWQQRAVTKCLVDARRKAEDGQTLQTQFANLGVLADPLSYVSIHVTDPKDRIAALHEMRSCCSLGIDQAFATDLNAGLFAIITVGKMDPRSVADYFLNELAARGIACKIAWAYTESTRQEDRARLPAVASRLLEGMTEIGCCVETVSEEQRSQKAGKIITDLRAERETWGLTRGEVAPIVGLSPPRLRDIEMGRACDSAESSRLTAFFGALSLARSSGTAADGCEGEPK